MLRAADFVKIVVAPFVLDDFKQFFVSLHLGFQRDVIRVSEAGAASVEKVEGVVGRVCMGRADE
jgi:hypothetical protein